MISIQCIPASCVMSFVDWGSDYELERRKNFANLKLSTSHVKWGVDWWPPHQSTSDRDCFWFAWSDDFPFRQILGFPTFDFERASIRRVTSSQCSRAAAEMLAEVLLLHLSQHLASCVTIERCPKELPSTNTISQLIQDTSTFSLLLVAAKWRLILFRSLSENESRSFLHLFSWIRKNNKDLCVYECMWNAHWVIGFGPHPSPV